MSRRDVGDTTKPAETPTGRAARFRLLMLGELTLLRPDGTQDPSLVSRGRKLVLLAYLALSRRPIARDRLATFLWGHRDDERARHSLRDALSVLRQSLGAMIPRGRESVGLAIDAPLDVDVLELRAAGHASDHARVVALYRGPFLDGVHVTDASEVEDWISLERRSIEKVFVTACAAECARLAEAQDWDACGTLAQRWLTTDPTDTAAFVWRLRALGAPNTPAALRGAVAEYQRHVSLLADEYDERAPPDAQAWNMEFLDRLARGREPDTAENGVGAAQTSGALPVASLPDFPVSSGLRRQPHAVSRRVVAVTAILLPTLALLALRARRDTAAAEGAGLIVAAIESPSRDPTDVWLEAGLPRLLTSSLVREGVPGVVDPTRVRALSRSKGLANSGVRVDEAMAIVVAQRLHAATLVTGEITRGGGRFLLHLVVRDVVNETVTHRIAVSDTSLFALVDQATARLLAAVDRPGPGFRFGDVETSSVEAYRAYILALERVDAGRTVDAAQLLDAAVAADSTFVAALQERIGLVGSRTTSARDSVRRLTVALSRKRLPNSDFDRRTLELTRVIERGDAVRAESIARDLVARYPLDARAYQQHIYALLNLGRFSEAGHVATTAMSLDSATRSTGVGTCATCGLYGVLVTTTLAAGDAAGAYAAARRAIGSKPREPAPWHALARALLSTDSTAEAIAAAERAMRLAPGEQTWAESFALLLLETGRFAAVDSLVQDWSRPGSERALAALDVNGLLLRERGEYEKAAKINALMVAAAKDYADSAASRLVLASSLAHSGDLAAAARVFEQAAVHPGRSLGALIVLGPSGDARAFAWPHALLADALFLGGSRDTLRLLAIADSVEAIGSHSTFGRDRRLHLHVRGLVAEIGGRWQEAERSFEGARWGRGGWTRTNVELARTQVAQGRPLDAVRSLRDSRFGTLDGMGRYEPRTEISAAIAEAFLSAHSPDSARVYVARVRTAWANADPPQRRRLADLERALKGHARVSGIDRLPSAHRPDILNGRP